MISVRNMRFEPRVSGKKHDRTRRIFSLRADDREHYLLTIKGSEPGLAGITLRYPYGHAPLPPIVRENVERQYLVSRWLSVWLK